MNSPLPDNPFTPGIAEIPPRMGHRPELEKTLLSILKHLRSDRFGPKFAFLYGPRGNGKTVLLHWFLKKAKTGKPIPCAYLTTKDLESGENLMRKLASATPDHGLVKRLFSYLSINLSFNAGAAMIRADIKAPDNSLYTGLGRDAFLILMDEAHTAKPERLNEIMNAVQAAGAETRIAMVLAGTPDLEDVLRSARVSYWSRGRRLRVNRLSAGEAELVVAEPFRAAGIKLEDGVAADLASTADRYPYFLQVYGAAAWEAMVSAGARTLDATHALRAKETGGLERRDYYRDRRSEFVEAEALPLAYAVAKAFAEGLGHMSDAQLEAVVDEVELAGWTLPGKLRFLRSRGFVWSSAPDVDWEPGVPSMMDYMAKEAG